MKKSRSKENYSVPRETLIECEKKIKFYDTALKFMIPSGIITLMGVIFFYNDIIGSGVNFMVFIPIAFIFAVSGIIFSYGMLYHMFKNKRWVWFVLELALIIFKLGPFFVALLFYFTEMRDSFKQGKGVYTDI